MGSGQQQGPADPSRGALLPAPRPRLVPRQARYRQPCLGGLSRAPEPLLSPLHLCWLSVGLLLPERVSTHKDTRVCRCRRLSWGIWFLF